MTRLRNKQAQQVIKIGSEIHVMSNRIDGQTPLRVIYELTTQTRGADEHED